MEFVETAQGPRHVEAETLVLNLASADLQDARIPEESIVAETARFDPCRRTPA